MIKYRNLKLNNMTIFTLKNNQGKDNVVKNNTNAIFQKTIAQKQTNQNLFIIDYCRRCSLASSQVRCSDVGEVHDRRMQV